LSNDKSIVLITTATLPPDGVLGLLMTDTAKRKVAALGAIYFWAALGLDKIVIADASGQTLLSETEAETISKLGVEIEQISYKQDPEMTLKFGKGYSEGLLIEFALENSTFLKYSENFFKCTGKVYCQNFQLIEHIIKNNNIRNIFWRQTFDDLIDTRFYYVSKQYAYTKLLPAYKNVDDKNNEWAEKTILAVVKNLVMAKTVRPILAGFSGSNDSIYVDAGNINEPFPCWVELP
jgi:hypothetical protein